MREKTLITWALRPKPTPWNLHYCIPTGKSTTCQLSTLTINPFNAYIVSPHFQISTGAFHSTKNSEISGPKLNGTVKIPGKVFENLGIRFECTLFDGISGIIENFVFHSREMSGLVSLPRTIRFPVWHTSKEQQHLFFWQNCAPPRWIASWIPPSVLYFLCQ